MALSKKLNTMLNDQVGNELFASHQYVAIAAYFDRAALPVLARHYYAQALEERQHALRLARLVMDVDGVLKIPAVPAPTMTFKNSFEAVQLALASEQRVTAQINALMDQAVADRDHMCKHELEWFVNEQREELTSATTLVQMVKRAGESGMFHVETFLKEGGLAEPGAGGEGVEGGGE